MTTTINGARVLYVLVDVCTKGKRGKRETNEDKSEGTRNPDCPGTE